MGVKEIIGLLSGVALFLFGMSVMGDGLKKASGNKLEPILFRLTNTMPKAVILGAAVTAVIQSSCATAVMVVGFVNSGMMKVRQGIYVTLGAILGTSITGWIICLSYIEGAAGIAQFLSTATLTGVVALTGIIMKMFAKKQGIKNIGDILLGFAVLMFGMSAMSDSVSALGEQPWFTAMLTRMQLPILGILVGTGFTALLQSASAAVGILQALSITGVMTFESALPLLMGISIGAALPVLLSALGAKTDGKRTALVYLVSSFMGVMLFASVFYIFNAIFPLPFMTQIMTPFSIALVNTLFRFIMLVMLAPFNDVMEALVKLIVREMTDLLTLDLVRKKLVTRKMELTVCYDRESLSVKYQGHSARDTVWQVSSTGEIYTGPLAVDFYGRITPKYAHGTENLDRWTSSTRRITDAVMALYDRIIFPGMLVRRICVVAAGLIREKDIPEEAPLQLDLFTDYENLIREKEEQAAADAKEKRLQEAALEIRDRFGKNAMLKGMNLEEAGTAIARNGQVGGHRA